MFDFTKIDESNYLDFEKLLNSSPISGSFSYILHKNLKDIFFIPLLFRNIKIATRDNKIVGSYSIDELNYNLNNQKKTISYLGLLRIFNNRHHNIALLKEGYKNVSKDIKQHDYSYTAISETNTQAIKLLEANLKFIPKYSLVSKITTFCISSKNKINSSFLVEISQTDFLKLYNNLSPNFNMSLSLNKDLLKNLPIRYFKYENGSKIAVFSLIDSSLYSGIKVLKYPFIIKLLLPIFNIGLDLFNYPKLPYTNKLLENSFFSFFVHTNNLSKEDITHIIRSSLFYAKNTISLTTFNDDELYLAIKNNLKYFKMTSNLYSVGKAFEIAKPRLIEGIIL